MEEKVKVDHEKEAREEATRRHIERRKEEKELEKEQREAEKEQKERTKQEWKLFKGSLGSPVRADLALTWA